MPLKFIIQNQRRTRYKLQIISLCEKSNDTYNFRIKYKEANVADI